ncbi:MAG: ATP-binding protein [Halodesulfurarchaeum sp.]
MKLRQTFAILLLLITLILSGVVYGQLEYTKQQSIEQVESTVEETARLTARQIGEEIDRQRDYVGYFASRAGASNITDPRQFLQKFLSNPRFYAVQIINENGTVVAFQGDIVRSVRNETVGANVSNRSYVSIPLSTGKTYVSEPERVESTGQSVIIIGAPIFEGTEITGVLAAAVELNRFTVFSTLVPLQTEVQSVTVTADSRVLYGPETRFREAISAQAKVPGTDWTVTVRRDRGPLEARLKRMALLQGGSLLLVLFTVIGLAVWEYRVTLGQTEKLLAGFEALRREDFDHKLDFQTGEEWETIGEGFNELSETLERRERAIKEREERLSVMNRVLRHNLRNDMTLILNYARLVADGAESARIREAGEVIEDRGENLIGLGETARQAAEAMEQADQTVEMDLVSEGARILGDVRSGYQDTSVSSPGGDRIIVAVVPMFELAIRNVIENAFEHNDSSDPSVSVRVTEDGEYGTLTVSDNGPGIPEQEVAALEGTEEPLEHGSGLGLWLAYWLVRKSGGEMTIESTDPPGTVVRISVPLAAS